MPRKSKKVKLIGLGLPANLLKEFIDLSYRGNTSIAPEGYDIDAPLSDSRVKVYQKKGSKQVIVTHRGSVGLDDWWDNAKFLVAGKVKSTKTFKLHKERQLKAVEKYGGENIIGLGHSRAGLYLQEMQKDPATKLGEIITYNKAVGFYDALRENPEEQTDVKVKNDFVSLLSGLQKRPNKMVEIDVTPNPLDFNKAHQPAELEKLGDTFIGKKEIEGGAFFEVPLPIQAASYVGRKTGLFGSGRAPSSKTIEQLNKILKTLEGKLEKINKGKVYKTTNKDKVSYDISYTKARIKNYEANGEDLIITKKKKYKDELPTKAKPYKAKPKKEEPKPEPPKPPKLKKQKAFLLTYKEPTPEPKKEEPKPEPKKEEPKSEPEPKKEKSKLAKIEEFINDTENYLNKKSTRAFNVLMKKYNDKDFIKSINSAQKFNDFYPTSQKCLSNYSSYLKNNFYEDEVILEPTAGLGSIVLWLLKNNVKSKIIATDFNQDINKYLKESFNGIDQVSILDHAKSDYLDMKNEYYKYNPSYIFLNPPFSNRNDKKYYLNFLYKALYDLRKSKHRIRERQLFFISPKLTNKNEKNDQSINDEYIDISKKKKEEIKKMLNINEDEWEELRPDHILKVNVCNDFGGTNMEAVLYHIIVYGDGEEEPKKEEPKPEPKKEEPKPKPPKLKKQKAFLLGYKEIKEESKPKEVKQKEVKAEPKIDNTIDRKKLMKIFSAGGAGITMENCREIVCKYNITSKDDFKKWIIKNHPDKGGTIDDEVFKAIMNCVSKNKYCKEEAPKKEVELTAKSILEALKVMEDKGIRHYEVQEEFVRIIRTTTDINILTKLYEEIEDIEAPLKAKYEKTKKQEDYSKYSDISLYKANLQARILRLQYNLDKEQEKKEASERKKQAKAKQKKKAPKMEGGYFWDSKETKEAKKAKREARQAEEKAKKEASRKELGEALTTFASKINEISKNKKATTAQKAVDTAPKAIESEQQGVEEGQQGIEEGEPMAGAGFNYLDTVAYPINPVYNYRNYGEIPSIIEPEDLFLVGGSFTDMAGMNCDKTTGQCFNPVWEKQKIKRQILSEYKIWYWPWGAPPPGHIRMAWLEPMIQERYQPLYDEFVARRNVNIGLPPDASKDRFAQQMFSNLTDGLSYVPVFNTVTSLGLSAASSLTDTKKEDGS